MNIHEYQAKDLFRKFNVATSEGKVFENENDAEEYAKSLNVDEYVWDPLESTCRHASLSIL